MTKAVHRWARMTKAVHRWASMTKAVNGWASMTKAVHRWGSTFAAFKGAGRDNIVQQIGHQEPGALNVTASDRHACLEHRQQFACSHVQTVRIAMYMPRI